MNNTIEYYNSNAKQYAADTLDANIRVTQDKFCDLIPSHGHILDFGCGSGRDTAYFISRGFIVDAIDGSQSLCEIATVNTGIRVQQMLFTELDESNKYDGIWACSSILHLSSAELYDVFSRMIRAMKSNAYLYTCFKYGVFEGYRGDRYFTDFDEKSFLEFSKDITALTLIESWITNDVRPNRGEEKWLNLILKKTAAV